MAGQSRADVRVAPEHHESEAEPDAARHARPPAVNTGNPRVAVAFPFSKIEISENAAAIRDLAAMIERLAGQVATIAHATAPDQAVAADQVAAEAALLARGVGAS